MWGRGDLQETTRLIGETTSATSIVFSDSVIISSTVFFSQSQILSGKVQARYNQLVNLAFQLELKFHCRLNQFVPFQEN